MRREEIGREEKERGECEMRREKLRRIYEG